MPESPPPETLAWLRHAASCGQRDAQLTLHILERLEALEKKYETQRLATLEWGKDVDKLMRWIDDHLKRIMALEQPRQDKLDRLIALNADDPTPEAAPVATDNGLLRCYAQAIEVAVKRGDSHDKAREAGRRACYNLGRQHGAAHPPAAQPAPPAPDAGDAGELVAFLTVGSSCGGGATLSPEQCRRVATLLQQLSAPAPVAVPVAERLPEPGDCDVEGMCWLLTTEDGYPQWRLHSIEGNQPGGRMIWIPVDKALGVMVDAFYASHWLPASAIPLPQAGDGE
jgi:hypothetical protein